MQRLGKGIIGLHVARQSGAGSRGKFRIVAVSKMILQEVLLCCEAEVIDPVVPIRLVGVLCFL